MKKLASLLLSFSLFFMTPLCAREEANQEDGRIKNLRKSGDIEEANRIHSAEVRKKENAQMITLIEDGKLDTAMMIHRARIQREEAKWGGILMIDLLQNGTGEQIAAATEFDRGIAARLARIQAQTLPNPATSTTTATSSSTQVPPSS